jgi:magnesium chelatase accessory protein
MAAQTSFEPIGRSCSWSRGRYAQCIQRTADPNADESVLVICFAAPRGIDTPSLSMLHDPFVSRPNIIVCLATDESGHAARVQALDLASHGMKEKGGRIVKGRLRMRRMITFHKQSESRARSVAARRVLAMERAQHLASDDLSWDRDGRDWPNRETSRFVSAAGLHWHVQQVGQGPALVLLHGTGASTHSWRSLMPLLARTFSVLALDLPGHGFTETPPDDGLTLRGIARDTGSLLRTLAVEPAVVVGHSAGAAIMLRMTLDGIIRPRALVSLNGALLPFGGAVSQFFSPLAKLLMLNPLVPRLFAWRASDRSAIERLIRNTGSTIDRRGLELYQRLVASPRHVAAALAMMANWDLVPLLRDLPKLQVPLLLVTGGNDRAISPDQAFRVQERLPTAKISYLRGLGHLAHEERPIEIADLIAQWAASSQVFGSG